MGNEVKLNLPKEIDFNDAERIEALPDITLTDYEDITKLIDEVDVTPYEYNGSYVPRVTNIIKYGQDQEGLITWASKVGYRNRERISNNALMIGSHVHELIEADLLGKKVDTFIPEADNYQQTHINTAYDNYTLWKQNLQRTGNHIDEIIGIEVPIVTPWFGGTIDCIAKINNAVYVLDFKTSRDIKPDYLIQVCSYAWAIMNGYCDICKSVDGVGILRFDKNNNGEFEEHFLNLFIPEQNRYIYLYMSTFWSMLNCYYHYKASNTILSNTSNSQEFNQVQDQLNLLYSE